MLSFVLCNMLHTFACSQYKRISFFPIPFHVMLQGYVLKQLLVSAVGECTACSDLLLLPQLSVIKHYVIDCS